VREVVVVGIPDDKWGEAVAAFVALRANPQADDAALMAFARERLAGYKVPKSVHFIEEVPTGSRREELCGRDPHPHPQDEGLARFRCKFSRQGMRSETIRA